MNRKEFMKVAAASMVAIGTEGANAKIFASPKDLRKRGATHKGIAVRFLGTGAADWKGPDARGEHRRLSSILIEGHILMDFTATCLDMIPEGCQSDTIFYTHSHGDHYNPAAALQAGVKEVYLSQTWHDIAKKEFAAAARKQGVQMPKITPLYIGQSVTVGDITITPLPASHATGNAFEQTLIYLIEKDGARLIYATDTGGIPAVAARLVGIDAHEKGEPITALIMEATMGMDHDNDFRIFTHTSVGGVERIVKVLEKTKRYTPPAGQPVYLTHMARTLHPTQAELDATLPKPLAAAYDGLEVIFSPL